MTTEQDKRRELQTQSDAQEMLAREIMAGMIAEDRELVPLPSTLNQHVQGIRSAADRVAGGFNLFAIAREPRFRDYKRAVAEAEGARALLAQSFPDSSVVITVKAPDEKWPRATLNKALEVLKHVVSDSRLIVRAMAHHSQEGLDSKSRGITVRGSGKDRVDSVSFPVPLKAFWFDRVEGSLAPLSNKPYPLDKLYEWTHPVPVLRFKGSKVHIYLGDVENMQLMGNATASGTSRSRLPMIPGPRQS